jgi:hypothetical protein
MNADVKIYIVKDKKRGRTWQRVLGESRAGAAHAIGLNLRDAVVMESDEKVQPFILRHLAAREKKYASKREPA